MGPVRTRRAASQSREEVLDAAVTEFAKAGLYGTSADAIAGRADVSQPYVFRLFGSKHALFMEAVTRGFDRIHALFTAEAVSAIADGADPFERMGKAYVSMLADRDELMLQMQSYAACGDPEVQALCRTRFAELRDSLLSLPGATSERVGGFLAVGMLLNVAAAIDLPALIDDAESMARQMCPEGAVISFSPLRGTTQE